MHTTALKMSVQYTNKEFCELKRMAMASFLSAIVYHEIALSEGIKFFVKEIRCNGNSFLKQSCS